MLPLCSISLTCCRSISFTEGAPILWKRRVLERPLWKEIFQSGEYRSALCERDWLPLAHYPAFVNACLHDATTCMKLVARNFWSILLVYLPVVKNRVRLRLHGNSLLYATRCMQLVASCKQAFTVSNKYIECSALFLARYLTVLTISWLIKVALFSWLNGLKSWKERF
jgi:hypothetical protein